MNYLPLLLLLSLTPWPTPTMATTPRSNPSGNAGPRFFVVSGACPAFGCAAVVEPERTQALEERQGRFAAQRGASPLTITIPLTTVSPEVSQ